MIIPKEAVFCVAALSFLIAGATTAVADVCADIRAKIPQIQHSMAQMGAEHDRVGRIHPLPYTDNALCKASLRVIDEAGFFLFNAHDGCFDSKMSDILFDAASEANKAASINAGIFHCKK